MSLRRSLVVALVATVLVMWVSAAYFHAKQPDQVPSHFDAEGHAVLVPKTLTRSFALPITFSLLTGIFVSMALSIPALAARYPRFINVPEKQKFLALPVDARIRALDPMRDLSLMMPIPLALLATYIAWGSSEVALGHARSLSPFPILVVMLSSFVCLGVTIVRMQKSIQHEIDASKTR